MSCGGSGGEDDAKKKVVGKRNAEKNKKLELNMNEDKKKHEKKKKEEKIKINTKEKDLTEEDILKTRKTIGISNRSDGQRCADKRKKSTKV